MYKETTVKNGGAELYCRVYGSNADFPILMIHGAVCDCDFFDETAEILSKNHKVICYDRRGYSRSTGDIGEENFFELSVSDAAAVIKEFSPNIPVKVIGCSAGAIIAIHLANKHSELISGMLLHEPPDTSKIPDDSFVWEISEKIIGFINAGKPGRGVSRLFGLLGNSDERGKPKSEDPVEKEEANAKFFVANEFTSVFTKEPFPEIPDTVPAMLAVGDAPREDFIRETTLAYAKENGYPVSYFPGMHNAANELPKDFAAQAEGFIVLGYI